MTPTLAEAPGGPGGTVTIGPLRSRLRHRAATVLALPGCVCTDDAAERDMNEHTNDGAAVNYGGSIKDAAGRPPSEETGTSKDGATVDEQLTRILPSRLPQGMK